MPGTFSPLLFGAHLLFNKATDDVRSKPAFLRSLESIPVSNLRFPGGTIGDNYLWREEKTARSDWFPFDYQASQNDLDFDEFMAVARCIGAQPTIVLNLRTWVARGDIEGGIAQAEDWLRYANQQKGHGIRYWELGNEVWGRKRQKQSPMLGAEYGRYYSTFRKRLKAIDPSIELGLVLPSKLEDVAMGDVGSWWDETIKGANGEIDYLVIHRYVVPPMRKLVRTGSTIDALLARIQEKTHASLGRPLPVHMTEWNIGSRSAGRPGIVRHDSIGHALFVADGLLDLAESGVRLATYWPLFGPADQGLLDKSDLSLNASGKAMKLLAPLAGWRIARVQSRVAPDMQISLLASGDNQQQAVVAINWSPRDVVVDWQALIGGCSASAQVLRPSGPVEIPEDLAAAAREDSAHNIAGAYSLAGFSVAVITTRTTAACN